MTLRTISSVPPPMEAELRAEQLVAPAPALGVVGVPGHGVHAGDLDRDERGLLHQLGHGELEHRGRRGVARPAPWTWR